MDVGIVKDFIWCFSEHGLCNDAKFGLLEDQELEWLFAPQSGRRINGQQHAANGILSSVRYIGGFGQA